MNERKCRITGEGFTCGADMTPVICLHENLENYIFDNFRYMGLTVIKSRKNCNSKTLWYGLFDDAHRRALTVALMS